MVNNSAAIAVEGLTVVRGGRRVLTDIDLMVPAGSVTGLLGPSGCGKTTLMRAIVGVQQVQEGSVTVLGRPAGAVPLRREVAYQTQTPSVYPNLTVAENLRFFAAVLGVPRAEVHRVLEQVDLSGHRDALVHTLSGGERSRVSLAVALLGRPRVLVLDEPTVGLDPVLRRDLWELFVALASDGATLLVSSHVMDEAERCQHLLLMREGRVIAQETPDRLLRATASRNIEDAFLALVAAA